MLAASSGRLAYPAPSKASFFAAGETILKIFSGARLARSLVREWNTTGGKYSPAFVCVRSVSLSRVIIVANVFQGTLFDCVSECLEPVVVGCVKSVPRYSVRLVRNESQPYQAIRVSGSDQAIRCCLQIVRDCLDNATKEKFLVVSLDSQNVAIGYQVITEGVLDASLVHPREVFQFAILTNAARLLLCHNHPSGDLTPSREDRAVTDRLKDCGKMMGIEVLDHIIVGNDPLSGEFRGRSLAATSDF